MSSSMPEQTRQRRRILKAAVGAPVMLTLPGGAALAAASTDCHAGSLTQFQAEGAETFASSPDQWMRVRLQKYEFRMRYSSGQWGAVHGFTFNGLWFKVTDGEAEDVSAYMHRDVDDPQMVVGEYYYGLVEYRNGEQLLVLDQQNGEIYPVAGASCWSSLTGFSQTSSVIDIL